MPELPEVETIRRALSAEFLGRELRKLTVKERVHLLKNCGARRLRERLLGRSLETIGRRAKYLLFGFGSETLVLHLRMSGRLLLAPAGHTRLVLEFAPAKKLYFDDTRRFAALYLQPTAELDRLVPLARLGLEPFRPEYTLKGFKGLLGSGQEIKRLLLDQHKLAGLGNIYACEVLYLAGIHPQRPAKSLAPAEARRLYLAIPKVLQAAINAGGSSIDSYRHPDGALGGFQNEFKVYGQAGRPCMACGTLIERIVQGGRSSFYCPSCQPRGL
ncbi:MAG TPA: bifunctional DNA-formamidopyrimidine glycosylase/DNA-(apurinic or apyrimidinic site) lyase [Candidatus Fraserbacteria bacterium]|nr:bifunctional DNA-formamidopyrimidine glycosylase/DNA-(apurinic or apyrimidinic site) lyase [Candidatus Fraserbacteria bacterium]